MNFTTEIIHILLSTLAFVVLCVAALQATLLVIQERVLRHKQAIAIIQSLPALESMEKWLFQLILLGFILLTLTLITSIFSFSHLLTTPLLQKTVLSFLAWIIFLALLIRRYYFGWRGTSAIRWTFMGLFLVMVIYFAALFYYR